VDFTASAPAPVDNRAGGAVCGRRIDVDCGSGGGGAVAKERTALGRLVTAAHVSKCLRAARGSVTHMGTVTEVFRHTHTHKRNRAGTCIKGVPNLRQQCGHAKYVSSRESTARDDTCAYGRAVGVLALGAVQGMTTGSDVGGAVMEGEILGCVTRGLNAPGRVAAGTDVVDRAGAGLNDSLARPTVAGEVCVSTGACLSRDWSHDELLREDTMEAENMVEPSEACNESLGMEGSKNDSLSSATKEWSAGAGWMPTRVDELCTTDGGVLVSGAWPATFDDCRSA
jgi:hypothetical protein